MDEPRSEKDTSLQLHLFNSDNRGRQLKGWTNKLIWGENKLILSSLKNGPMRDEIETQDGVKLIYIDPPFDVGADFSMDIEIVDDTFTKKPNILEEIAYRDTWGKGADSFISMIYERQHYIGVNPNLREEEQQKQPEEREAAFLDLILRAYQAERVEGFRTKKDRALELMSIFHECLPGRRKLAVKVVDIFGNDTMKIVEVTI